MNNELRSFLKMKIAEAGIEGVVFNVDNKTDKVYAVEVRRLKEKDVYYVPENAFNSFLSDTSHEELADPGLNHPHFSAPRGTAILPP
jgi:hypothetical protein